MLTVLSIYREKRNVNSYDYSEALVLYYIITENLSKQLYNNGIFINDILCYTPQNDSLNISSIIKKKREIVVLYGGDNYCNSCIDYHIRMIDGIANMIGKDNVILLFNDVSARELLLIKTNNDLKIPLYATQDIVPMFSEDNQPCFFILNKNLQILNTFYPIKEKANYNKVFYDYVISRFDKYIE